ncbi:MAG: hypothetical protein AAGA48_30020 [Myxococcota bacterium]
MQHADRKWTEIGPDVRVCAHTDGFDVRVQLPGTRWSNSLDLRRASLRVNQREVSRSEVLGMDRIANGIRVQTAQGPLVLELADADAGTVERLVIALRDHAPDLW